MEDIVNIVKFFEEIGLLTKVVSKPIWNEAKNKNAQKRARSMLLGTLGASLLENLFTGKATIRAGAGTIRVSQDF